MVDRSPRALHPEGRCTIGWIASDVGRTSYDVRLDVHTGEAREKLM
jgi:hypothetical protein